MTRKDLIKALDAAVADSEGDPEVAHKRADQALIEFIDDLEVRDAFERIEKWYA